MINAYSVAPITRRAAMLLGRENGTLLSYTVSNSDPLFFVLWACGIECNHPKAIFPRGYALYVQGILDALEEPQYKPQFDDRPT